MKTFGWSRERCRNGMGSAEGWVWYFWALENEMNAFGKIYECVGKGYIAQESDRLFEQAKATRK